MACAVDMPVAVYMCMATSIDMDMCMGMCMDMCVDMCMDMHMAI